MLLCEGCDCGTSQPPQPSIAFPAFANANLLSGFHMLFLNPPLLTISKNQWFARPPLRQRRRLRVRQRRRALPLLPNARPRLPAALVYGHPPPNSISASYPSRHRPRPPEICRHREEEGEGGGGEVGAHGELAGECEGDEEEYGEGGFGDC